MNEMPTTDASQTTQTPIEFFIAQFKGGTVSCEMDSETVQNLALAVEAQRKALNDLITHVVEARSPDVTVRMKEFRAAMDGARAAMKL